MFLSLFVQAENRILQSCVAFRKNDSLLKHNKKISVCISTVFSKCSAV